MVLVQKESGSKLRLSGISTFGPEPLFSDYEQNSRIPDRISQPSSTTLCDTYVVIGKLFVRLVHHKLFVQCVSSFFVRFWGSLN